MKRLGIVLATMVLTLGTVLAGIASAATSTSAFAFHVADALLQNAVGSPPYAIAKADNGDTVMVQGNGMMDAATGAASGSGVFIHHMAATGVDVHGTWTANRLISFSFNGCDTGPFPANFCGGLAKLAVTLTPNANPSLHLAGTLWVDCLIGPKVPGGRAEGIRLNVQDVINFNTTVESGDTLFVTQ